MLLWGCSSPERALYGAGYLRERYTEQVTSGIVCFFFKIYFYYLFIGKADIQRGETERKIFPPMIHSPSERKGPILCQSEARSLFRVSHAGAGSQSFGPSSPAFPGHRQGAGMEAGLPPLEPVPIWDPGLSRQGPLTTCATMLGPHRECYMEQVTSGTCC